MQLGTPFLLSSLQGAPGLFPKGEVQAWDPHNFTVFPSWDACAHCIFCIYHPLANAEDFMPFGPVPCDFVPGTLSEYLESARERKGMATFIPGSRP